jgi:hypothetical protein
MPQTTHGALVSDLDALLLVAARPGCFRIMHSKIAEPVVPGQVSVSTDQVYRKSWRLIS